MNTPAPPRWRTGTRAAAAAPALASTAFQADPQPLVIDGVQAAHAPLFAGLEGCTQAADARQLFVRHMDQAFDPPAPEAIGPAPDGQRSTPLALKRRTGVLRLLQGWGLDANGAAGAVLKGWVDSRFGLAPTFHQAPLVEWGSAAWTSYLEQKAGARWHYHHIHAQLDLLYSYAQWMLARFGLVAAPGARHVRLWRGSNRADEQLVAGSLRQRHCTVRLNNVVSFSLSRDDAECFGDWVFEAQVPTAKLLFVPGLLHAGVLHGEAEVIAIGGDYAVEARYAR